MSQIIVTGCGRCGSSLVMQMLSASGQPVTGEYPAFELDGPPTQHQFKEPYYKNKVIKALDLHIFGAPPSNDAKFIVCVRDERQQAKSFVKFSKAMLGFQMNKEAEIKIRKSIKRDIEDIVKIIGNRNYITISFEEMIKSPNAAAAKLSNFIGIDSGKILKMAQTVRKRDAKCYNGFLEIELLDGGGAV